MSTIRRSLFPLAALLTVAGAARSAEAPRVVEDGLLDLITLHADRLPSGTAVVIRPFDTSTADLGTGAEGGKESRVAAVKKIQADGPHILASSFVAALAKTGHFASVREDDGGAVPEGALVVEGRFSQIDPGSKAKRYWVGFGAGRSGTEVEGSVKDGAGNVLATFKQQRIAVMGVFGGDYVAKMTSDCRAIGEDLADFLDAWATGKPLKKEKTRK